MASAYKNLPVTRSSPFIQNKGTEAYYLFVLLAIFSLVNYFTDNFLLSVFLTLFMLMIFKLYLNSKPPKFLVHLFEYFLLPKKLTHQFVDRRDLFLE